MFNNTIVNNTIEVKPDLGLIEDFCNHDYPKNNEWSLLFLSSVNLHTFMPNETFNIFNMRLEDAAELKEKLGFVASSKDIGVDNELYSLIDDEQRFINAIVYTGIDTLFFNDVKNDNTKEIKYYQVFSNVTKDNLLKTRLCVVDTVLDAKSCLKDVVDAEVSLDEQRVKLQHIFVLGDNSRINYFAKMYTLFFINSQQNKKQADIDQHFELPKYFKPYKVNGSEQQASPVSLHLNKVSSDEHKQLLYKYFTTRNIRLLNEKVFSPIRELYRNDRRINNWINVRDSSAICSLADFLLTNDVFSGVNIIYGIPDIEDEIDISINNRSANVVNQFYLNGSCLDHLRKYEGKFIDGLIQIFDKDFEDAIQIHSSDWGEVKDWEYVLESILTNFVDYYTCEEVMMRKRVFINLLTITLYLLLRYELETSLRVMTHPLRMEYMHDTSVFRDRIQRLFNYKLSSIFKRRHCETERGEMHLGYCNRLQTRSLELAILNMDSNLNSIIDLAIKDTMRLTDIYGVAPVPKWRCILDKLIELNRLLFSKLH